MWKSVYSTHKIISALDMPGNVGSTRKKSFVFLHQYESQRNEWTSLVNLCYGVRYRIYIVIVIGQDKGTLRLRMRHGAESWPWNRRPAVRRPRFSSFTWNSWGSSAPESIPESVSCRPSVIGSVPCTSIYKQTWDNALCANLRRPSRGTLHVTF